MLGDGESVMWGGARSKGERSQCDYDKKTFLQYDLVKLCLKRKCNINKFLPDTAVFLNEKNSRY